jgi:hypothetical protein
MSVVLEPLSSVWLTIGKPEELASLPTATMVQARRHAGDKAAARAKIATEAREGIGKAIRFEAPVGG